MKIATLVKSVTPLTAALVLGIATAGAASACWTMLPEKRCPAPVSAAGDAAILTAGGPRCDGSARPRRGHHPRGVPGGTPTSPTVPTPTEPTEPQEELPTDPNVVTPVDPGGLTPTETGGTTPTEPANPQDEAPLPEEGAPLPEEGTLGGGAVPGSLPGGTMTSLPSLPTDLPIVRL